MIQRQSYIDNMRETSNYCRLVECRISTHANPELTSEDKIHSICQHILNGINEFSKQTIEIEVESVTLRFHCFPSKDHVKIPSVIFRRNGLRIEKPCSVHLALAIACIIFSVFFSSLGITYFSTIFSCATQIAHAIIFVQIFRLSCDRAAVFIFLFFGEEKKSALTSTTIKHFAIAQRQRLTAE